MVSRVGKLPITIPQGISVSLNGSVLEIKNSKKAVKYDVGQNVKVELTDKEIKLSGSNSMEVGTHRSNIYNIIKGLSDGFKTILEFNGVGYKSSINGKILVLSLGYSHDIHYYIPEYVTITCDKPNLIIVSGDDKTKVGQIVDEIKRFRKVEPYKGKGIITQGQKVLRKEGKKK